VNARFGGSDDEVSDMEEKIRRAAADALKWRQTP
jgi:hypothetical protein